MRETDKLERLQQSAPKLAGGLEYMAHEEMLQKSVCVAWGNLKGTHTAAEGLRMENGFFRCTVKAHGAMCMSYLKRNPGWL